MKLIKVILLSFAVIFSLQVGAQRKGGDRFDPKRFEADMEQYIAKEACLTPQESSVFFPVFREMQAKKRAIFVMMGRYRHIDTRNNKACEEAVREMDKADIKMKKLQMEYHEKFFNVIPAGKVMKVIQAEDRFMRFAFHRAAKRSPKPQK